MAFIRELIANAQDIHIKTGCRAPFEITLPTELAPVFRVRDFGSGLSLEQMTEYFCSYAASTKTETNDQAGAFGIGCKSPFGYTNSFSVTSIQNGKRVIYNCVMDDTDMGEMLQMSPETDTEEPDGLEISVPVEKSDIDGVIARTRYIFNYLDNKPKVYNHPESFNKDPYEIVERGSTWVAEKPTGVFGNQFVGRYARVRIGGFCYPLSISALGFRHGSVNYNLVEHQYLVVDLPMGSVDISHTREGLSYTRKTKTMVKWALRKVIREFVEQIAPREIYEDSWDARIAAVNLVDSGRWKCAKAMLGYNQFETLFSFQTKSGKRVRGFKYDNPNWDTLEFRSYTLDTYDADKPKLKFVITKKIIPGDETVLVYDDGVKNTAGRIKQLLLDKYNDKKPTTIIFLKGSETEICRWAEHNTINFERFVALSTIEPVKPKRTSHTRSTTSVGTIMRLNKNGCWVTSDVLERYPYSTKREVYIPLYSGQTIKQEVNGFVLNTKALATLVESDLNVGVFGVRPNDVKHLDTRWELLDTEFVHKLTKDWATNNNTTIRQMNEAVATAAIISKWDDKQYDRWSISLKTDSFVAPLSAFWKRISSQCILEQKIPDLLKHRYYGTLTPMNGSTQSRLNRFGADVIYYVKDYTITTEFASQLLKKFKA